MNASTWRLQGSASTLQALADLIRKRWYWETVRIESTDDPAVFTVSHHKGIAEGLRVVFKRGRYRLEVRA